MTLGIATPSPSVCKCPICAYCVNGEKGGGWNCRLLSLCEEKLQIHRICHSFSKSILVIYLSGFKLEQPPVLKDVAHCLERCFSSSAPRQVSSHFAV